MFRLQGREQKLESEIALLIGLPVGTVVYGVELEVEVLITIQFAEVCLRKVHLLPDKQVVALLKCEESPESYLISYERNNNIVRSGLKLE